MNIFASKAKNFAKDKAKKGIEPLSFDLQSTSIFLVK
jgi:hypothetical protein